MFATTLAACAPTIGSVGAVLAQNGQTGRVIVRDAPHDMTGAKAGLEAGDEILEIDGHDVRDSSPEEIANELRGEVGTKVALTILRGTEVKRIVVVRGAFRRGKVDSGGS